MSLINQMLQDLDARKVGHGTGSGLPNEVRPLPVVQALRWPILAVAILLLLLVGAFAVYFWMMSAKAVLPVPPPEPISIAPPVPTAPVPEPEKIVQPEAPPVEPQPVVSELQDLNGSLRMADVLKLPAEKKTAKKAIEDRKETTARSTALIALPPAPLVPAPVAAVKADAQATDRSPKPPMIEKTDALGSPRDRAETEYRKAISAVNQGRVDEALTGLRNALRQDAYHLASRQLLVKLLLEAKRVDEAIQVLQDGLQTQPAQLGWAMSLARLQMDRGDLAGAWQTLNYSQPAAANNADYQGFSGHVLQRLGRHKDAIERYLAAARLSPNDGRWWLGLGLSLEAEGRTSEAKEAFQHAKQTGNLSAELISLVEQKLK